MPTTAHLHVISQPSRTIILIAALIRMSTTIILIHSMVREVLTTNITITARTTATIRMNIIILIITMEIEVHNG
jgi:hypothetical protein